MHRALDVGQLVLFIASVVIVDAAFQMSAIFGEIKANTTQIYGSCCPGATDHRLYRRRRRLDAIKSASAEHRKNGIPVV